MKIIFKLQVNFHSQKKGMYTEPGMVVNAFNFNRDREISASLGQTGEYREF